MPIEFAEGLLENDDFRVETDANGDLIQEHKQTGAQFKFDSTKNRWIPVQGIDLENANLDNANFGTNVDAQGNDINNIGAVSTEQIVTNYHFAEAYDGSDADTRLDNAISAAASGDTIYLETASYSTNRTISSKIRLVGPGSNSISAEISGTWTLSSRISLENISRITGELVINGAECSFSDSYGFTGDVITVGADLFRMTNCGGYDVTFQSGTSGGIVDGCSSTNVTDNGTNTIGDIA